MGCVSQGVGAFGILAVVIMLLTRSDHIYKERKMVRINLGQKKHHMFEFKRGMKMLSLVLLIAHVSSDQDGKIMRPEMSAK